MRIHTLWDRHKGQDIWIIGTGPSMKVFPHELYRNHTTIGLNQAWRYGVPLTYSITVHPELIIGDENNPDAYMKSRRRPITTWIVKPKPPMQKLAIDDPNYYVFKTGAQYDLGLIRKRTPDHIFLGHGIHCSAMALAAHMGARSITLVGVDMASLDDEHHGHGQHVQFHGLTPDVVYKEYRYWAAKVRKVIRDELKIPILTLSPFLGIAHPHEDWARIHMEKGLGKQPPPKDTSSYIRPEPKL